MKQKYAHRFHVLVKETDKSFIIGKKGQKGVTFIPKEMPNAKGIVESYLDTWDINRHKQNVKEAKIWKRLERESKKRKKQDAKNAEIRHKEQLKEFERKEKLRRRKT